VTWLIDDGLDCADLTLLGLPTPSVVEQPASAEDWSRLDPEWMGDNRVAVVLGELYRD